VTFLDERTRRGLFDRAVAHFNAREFWESHEDWETIWHESVDPERRWIQGLIQVAAAFFHVERGFYASGFLKLLRGADEKMAGYRGDTRGIRFDLLGSDLEAWRAHARRVESGRPLREAMPPYPVIRYQDGVVPEPLPPGATVGESPATPERER
jgi:hypothetical protein